MEEPEHVENPAWIRVDRPDGKEFRFVVTDHGGLVVLKAMYDALKEMDPETEYTAGELFDEMEENIRG